MAHQGLSLIPEQDQKLPSAAVYISLVGYILLNTGLVVLIVQSPFLAICGILGLNLAVLLFLQPRWAVPLYVLIAAPSLTFPFASTGILSRLYVANLLLALLIAIGLISKLAARNKSWQDPAPTGLLAPIAALVLVGLASVIFSNLNLDPRVTYSFPHSDVPLVLTNLVEVVTLLTLPGVVFILPSIVETMRDVEWIVRALIGIGLLYALCTIFAGPLGLYSTQVLLGYSRPQVFGEISSGLGMLLVFFTCIALSKALYASTQPAGFCYWVFTVILGIGVIMALGREAWIALGLSVLVIISFRFRSFVPLLGAPLLALLLFPLGVYDFYNPQVVYGIDRVNIWQDAITIWRHSPYLGVGAGNFQFFDIAYGTDIVGVAHNQFLEVLAEMGVQGLLCLIWAMAIVCRVSIQRFNAAKTSLGKAVALASIGYCVTVVFGGFFEDPFLPSVARAGGTTPLVGISYRWILLGLMLAIPRWEMSAQVADESGKPGQEQFLPKGKA